MQAVRAALSGTGEAKHPTLQKFFAEAALYKHVGLNFDDLRHRPHQEAVDYLTISALISNEEARRAAQQKAEAERHRR